MRERRCSELDLREMMEKARGAVSDVAPDRWLIVAPHRGVTWHVIVEPDFDAKLLVIVTAYPVQPPT